MPYNFDRLISEVRIDLDNPDPSAPNDDLIFLKAADVAQLRHNDAQNSPVSWSLRYWDLQALPGKEEYLIPAGEQFGKPARIHTIDLADRYHVSRKVEVSEIQNVDEFYRGPILAPASGRYHSAAVFLFYYRFGQPYLRLVPTPNENSRYRVWHETGELPEAALGDNLPTPGAFHRYLRISTAVACLAYCHWSRLLGDEPEKMEPEKILQIMQRYQKTLADGLLKQEIEFARAYDDYIETQQQSGVGEPNGYGDWAGDGW